MKYIYGLLSVLLLGSCKNHSPVNAVRSILVNTNKIDTTSFFLDDKLNKHIVLETTPESTIGTIDKLIVRENKIYILDKEITKSLFVFSIEGKFLYKISSAGRGPGEYMFPDDFSIDNSKNEVLIWDISQKKINFYNKNQFVREKTIPHEFSFISHLRRHIVAVNAFCMEKENCFKVLLFDESFNIKEKLEPFERKDDRVEWDLQIPLFEDNSGVYITEAFSNTIHKVDNDLNYTPFVTIDFQGKGISYKEKEKKPRDEFLSALYKSNKAFLVDNFLRSNNLEYFTFFHNQNMVFNFSVEGKVISSYSLINENKIFFLPVYIDENYLYAKTDAMNFIELDKDYQNKLGDISEMNNPIITKIPLDYIKSKVMASAGK